MRIDSAIDLTVYAKAFDLAMRVYEATKAFPPEERYALNSQIRRSSRSVCLNLREAWAKRRHEAAFIAKLTDCDGENSETQSALDFAFSCSFISADLHAELIDLSKEVGRMLGKMIQEPEGLLTRPVTSDL